MRVLPRAFILTLILILCAAGAAYAGCPWAGEYKTAWGKLVLKQDGDKVTGTYGETRFARGGFVSGVAAGDTMTLEIQSLKSPYPPAHRLGIGYTVNLYGPASWTAAAANPSWCTYSGASPKRPTYARRYI